MVDDILIGIPTADITVDDLAESLRSVIDYLRQADSTTVYTDPITGEARILIGFQLDGWGAGKSMGIKVSKPGYDVRLATSDQLALSYDLASLDISGNLTVTGTFTNATN